MPRAPLSLPDPATLPTDRPWYLPWATWQAAGPPPRPWHLHQVRQLMHVTQNSSAMNASVLLGLGGRTARPQDLHEVVRASVREIKAAALQAWTAPDAPAGDPGIGDPGSAARRERHSGLRPDDFPPAVWLSTQPDLETRWAGSTLELLAGRSPVSAGLYAQAVTYDSLHGVRAAINASRAGTSGSGWTGAAATLSAGPEGIREVLPRALALSTVGDRQSGYALGLLGCVLAPAVLPRVRRALGPGGDALLLTVGDRELRLALLGALGTARGRSGRAP